VPWPSLAGALAWGGRGPTGVQIPQWSMGTDGQGVDSDTAHDQGFGFNWMGKEENFSLTLRPKMPHSAQRVPLCRHGFNAESAS